MPGPNVTSKLQPLSQSEEGESKCAREHAREIKTVFGGNGERELEQSEKSVSLTNRTQRGCDLTLTGAGG